MESWKALRIIGGLVLIGLMGSAPAMAQTSSSAAPAQRPVLLDTVYTECDQLVLEIENPERKVFVGKARTVRILLTTPTLKYTGGTLRVPEGANLLMISRPSVTRINGQAAGPAENRVTWQFYKAANPKEFLTLRSSGVYFRDQNGKVIPGPEQRGLKIHTPIQTQWSRPAKSKS